MKYTKGIRPSDHLYMIKQYLKNIFMIIDLIFYYKIHIIFYGSSIHPEVDLLDLCLCSNASLLFFVRKMCNLPE